MQNEKNDYSLVCLQIGHAVCGLLHTWNMKLPIRLSSNGNSKIVPKLLKICCIGKKTRKLQLLLLLLSFIFMAAM